MKGNMNVHMKPRNEGRQPKQKNKKKKWNPHATASVKK
jgi:hypothetical protein